MDDASGRRPEDKRTAVVFIHGQGQQRPMEDVRELARTVWESDPRRKVGDAHAKSWTVPDARLGMADLGRVTTEAGRHGMRVDFFELYWAHFMEDNRFEHFLAWFRMLLDRPRREAPHGLLPVRQWTIRFFESITLMSLLFSYVVAMLLPPLLDGLPAARLSEAVFDLPIWTSADVGFILAGLTGLMIVAAWLGIIINEVRGGVGHTIKRASLLGLRVKAESSRVSVATKIVVSLVLIVLIVHLFIWQGPAFDWGDARLPLLLATMLGATFLALRQMSNAAMVAVPTAVVALVCAMLGGVDANHIWQFGTAENMTLFAWTPDAAAPLSGAPSEQAALSRVTSDVYFALYMFAGLWSFAGVNSRIGAARRWWWRLLFTTIVVGLSIAGGFWMLRYFYTETPFLWGVYSAGVTLMVTLFAGFILSRLAADAFLTPVMTDSARYFSREPQHVVARQRIREAGVRLLDKLHDPASGYERIIVVAHSLGTAVGYELLLDYWSRQCGAYVMNEGDGVHQALAGVERATHALNAAATQGDRDAAQSAFRSAQRQLSHALAEMTVTPTSHGHEEGKTWLITDFVTLGSPLTHASLLLADSRKDLWEKQRERTLAACPPITFDDAGNVDLQQGHLSFVGWDLKRRPVHSALFAAVRWTNHFFKTGDWIIQGDVIGGPIGPPVAANPKQTLPPEEICGGLGRGVRDCEVDRSGTGKLFAHNEYWRSDLDTGKLCTCLEQHKPQHIAALIEALDLDDRERARTPAGSV